MGQHSSRRTGRLPTRVLSWHRLAPIGLPEVTETADTGATLPPMPELETSMDDTGAGVAEDLETVDGPASPEGTDEPEDDDVPGDAPIAP